jgi:hypothetical protein
MAAKGLVAEKLYKIKRTNDRGNTGSTGLVILKHTAAPSIQMLGSESLPSDKADMVDIVGELMILRTAYSMFGMPTYIYFVGTVTSIELTGYDEVSELGALA